MLEIKAISPEEEIALKRDINKMLVLGDELDNNNENETGQKEEANALASEKMSNLLQEQLKEFQKPVDENTPLPIEIKSYHTIDYFASQGIKLDPQAQDKLGKQVLRFTDWLKQMKSINPKPSDLGTEKDLESKVAAIADSSNQPEEVITEAMAEVLEKQGKTTQAKALYQKLSLLHPDKSAYFATRIDNLK